MGDNVGVGVDVGNNVSVTVGVGVRVGDGEAATARSVATPPDLREVHPAGHRSRSSTASSSQPRRGREAAVGLAKGMARCATQGDCEDDPGLYAAGPDRTARRARGRRPFEIARKAKHSPSHAA